jgi:transposase
VKGLAKELGIKLEFLPSYSPNLIERLWKFTKKKCSYNVYYETFDEFAAGITDCLNGVEGDYKDKLKSLMKPNFQNVKKGRF